MRLARELAIAGGNSDARNATVTASELPAGMKLVKVTYNATCQSVVMPQVAADAEPFAGEVPLYFTPSVANGFDGVAGWGAVP